MEDAPAADALQSWRGDAFPFYRDFFVVIIEQYVVGLRQILSRILRGARYKSAHLKGPLIDLASLGRYFRLRPRPRISKHIVERRKPGLVLLIARVNFGTCQKYSVLECAEGFRRKDQYANVETTTIR